MIHIRTRSGTHTLCGEILNGFSSRGSVNNTIFPTVREVGQDTLSLRLELDQLANASDCPACRKAWMRNEADPKPPRTIDERLTALEYRFDTLEARVVTD